MKRPSFIIFAFFWASAVLLFGITEKEAPFPGFLPNVAAQGGSAVATASGFTALSTNPAGFANGAGDITFLSSTFWLHGDPLSAPDVLGLLYSGNADDDDSFSLLEKQFTGKGFGFGGSLGIGYVQHGIGLGFTASFDEYYYGSSFPEAVTGLLVGEFSFVAGYAIPFQLGPSTLIVGADVRPLVRIYAPLDTLSSARMIWHYFRIDGGDTTDPFDTTYALNGSGVAIDAGLIFKAGALSFGAALRDLFDTELRYSWDTLADIKAALLQGGLPKEKALPESKDYIIPMHVSFGLSYHPDLKDLSGIIDPILHCELKDPFGALDEDEVPEPAFIKRLHFGAEVRLFKRLRLWGGLNQACPTFGLGFRLAFLDFGAAYFSREIGTNTGYFRTEGIAINLSFRL